MLVLSYKAVAVLSGEHSFLNLLAAICITAVNGLLPPIIRATTMALEVHRNLSDQQVRGREGGREAGAHGQGRRL